MGLERKENIENIEEGTRICAETERGIRHEKRRELYLFVPL